MNHYVMSTVNIQNVPSPVLLRHDVSVSDRDAQCTAAINHMTTGGTPYTFKDDRHMAAPPRHLQSLRDQQMPMLEFAQNNDLSKSLAYDSGIQANTSTRISREMNRC